MSDETSIEKPEETVTSDPLLVIGERLRADLKKNNHHTAEPMFCLQALHRETGYDAAYADNRCWWNPEAMEVVYDDDTDERKADLGFKDPGHGPSNEWEGPFGYKDQWRTVMVALTQKGLDDYMELDGHNVKRAAFRGKTRTYVESFYRCQEMIDLREALIGIAKITSPTDRSHHSETEPHRSLSSQSSNPSRHESGSDSDAQ